MTFLFNGRSSQTAIYIFFFTLSILSATAFLSVASGQTQADMLCSDQACISATVFSKDNKTIEFSLFSKIQVGWFGVGIGGSPNSMPGNDLAICWPNATGTGAVISQRSATINGPPTPGPSIAFRVLQAKSGVTIATNVFTCTFTRPFNLTSSPLAANSTSINVIYAMGTVPVKPGVGGNPQLATLVKHTYTGHGTLPIQKKAGSSSDKNNSIIINPPNSGGVGENPPNSGGAGGNPPNSGGVGGNGTNSGNTNYPRFSFTQNFILILITMALNLSLEQFNL